MWRWIAITLEAETAVEVCYFHQTKCINYVNERDFVDHFIHVIVIMVLFTFYICDSIHDADDAR